MEKSPKNKMIGEKDESVKGSGRKLGKQATRFFFPTLQKSVVAETEEEALAIINKQKES